MVAHSRSKFVRLALLSGLVSQQQIDHAIQTVRDQGGRGSLPAVEVGDERLVLQLVEMGFLTNYQADQIMNGRTKLNLGPYFITDFLGQGGMGQVFVAEHKMMGRKVAIKVLPKSKSTPIAINGFTREIRTQAKLDHKNLVRAFDAGHDGSVYFLVTEFVPGTDLRRLIRSQGPLTVCQAASVVVQAANGLEYAHQQGLIHRDVKPGNILVTPEGIVKVSDLGLASYLRDDDDDPRAGKIVGTPDYLSPEKITSPKNVTSVSDIYSLGCTLYYAVTGKVPFPGGSTRDKARRHCEETPWHPRQFNPDISNEFVDLIADMMEKDPARRIQTAAEVANRLEQWADLPSSIPKPQLTRSPWSPPPVPTDRDETLDDLGDVGFEAQGEDSQSSSSQISQVTFPISNSGSETDPSHIPEPPPSQNEIAALIRRKLILTLVISAPVFAAIGALIAWWVLSG